MTDDTVNAVIERTMANLALLTSCPGPHDFRAAPAKAHGVLIVSYVCSKCGGSCNTEQKHWYDRGIQHGTVGGEG